ncbi:MAG TPA: hypothetical protein VN703_07500 [Candidatus Sulfopaludibacter sp.]|nr:hypothetical protein [Candidatus Sulfopaludibacter sp.]
MVETYIKIIRECIKHIEEKLKIHDIEKWNEYQWNRWVKLEHNDIINSDMDINIKKTMKDYVRKRQYMINKDVYITFKEK